MLSSLRMGLRLVMRTRMLLIWLLGMLLMAAMNRNLHDLAPDLRAASWILLAAVWPGFVVALFAREFLAQPLSFFMAGLRRTIFKTQAGLCLSAGLATVLAMRLAASVSWAEALAMGALSFAYSAFTCVVTLRFARWGAFVWMVLIQWPLFGVRVTPLLWVRDQAWPALLVGAGCLVVLGHRAANVRLHRSLCGRPVAQLADWWDPARWERMKVRREGAGQLGPDRPGSRLLVCLLARVQAATVRGNDLAGRSWQLAWVVVSRSLPQSRRNLSALAMFVVCVLVAPYIDSHADRSAAELAGWFSGFVVLPALGLASGMVRLGRCNGVLLSRVLRERAGLLVGMGAVVVAGISGFALWGVGRVFAWVLPAVSIGNGLWTYHAPAAHVAWLPLAIAPAQLLTAAARRRPGTSWPAGLGVQVFLLMQVLCLGVPGGVSVWVVAGFAVISAAAFGVVWRRRCRLGDVVE
jgi:hypothetical protein